MASAHHTAASETPFYWSKLRSPVAAPTPSATELGSNTMRIANVVEHLYHTVRSVLLFLTPLKYYRNDSENYVPLPFSTILESVQTKLHRKSDIHWILDCTYKNETRQTQIFLTQKFDSHKPSLVFHHPSGETNHTLAYSLILGNIISKHCNVFLIKAQKHCSTTEFLNECVDSFLHHQLTFAGSVLAVESIVKEHHETSGTPIIITGASMGGVVASLHAYIFGTADYYVPLVAYPNVGEIFLGDAYKYAVSDWKSKRESKAYCTSFTLTKPFPPAVAKRITPALGQFDPVVPYDTASAFWKRMNVACRVYPYGHFTPGIMRKDIQTLILHMVT